MRVIFLFLVTATLLLSGCLTQPDVNEDDFLDYQNRTNSNLTENRNRYDDSGASGYYDVDYNIGFLYLNNFGITKANNPDLLEALRSIVTSYDIIVLQGITQDITAQTNQIPMNNVISDMDNGERMMFFYSHSVEPGRLFYYDGGGFARRPVAMDFSLENNDIVVVGVSINPYNAEQEIRRLPSVVDWATNNFDTDKVIIVGNMYADCVFFDSFHVVEREGWRWVIGNDRTTVQDLDCAYDRIIVAHKSLQGNGEVDTLGHIRREILRGVTHRYAVTFKYFERVYY